MARTMGIPAQCPTTGPQWFVDNYTTICKGLVAGLSTKEIVTELVKAGVDEDEAQGVSNKVSQLIREFKLPDFPQLKGFTSRTTRRKQPTFAFDGIAKLTTTIETEDTPLNGRGVATFTRREKGGERQRLDAILRVVNSNEFDDASKIKYIRAELGN